MTDIHDTLNERGSRYGDYFERARITQNLKRAMADSLTGPPCLTT